MAWADACYWGPIFVHNVLTQDWHSPVPRLLLGALCYALSLAVTIAFEVTSRARFVAGEDRRGHAPSVMRPAATGHDAAAPRSECSSKQHEPRSAAWEHGEQASCRT